MLTYDIPFELDLDHRRCLLGNEPMIFHCNHYNNYLQRTIVEDAPYIDSARFLIGAAAEVSYHQLSTLFAKTPGMSEQDKKQKACEIFAWAGFGKIDLSSLSKDGGDLTSSVTHYSVSWSQKFGKSDKPVDYFTTGWIAGAMAVIFNLDLANIRAEQKKCLSMGHDNNLYQFSIGSSNFKKFQPVGVGELTVDKALPVENNNIDYDGVLQAVSGMKLEGNEEGLIPAFGVLLTRNYANYYNRISFEFIRAMQEKFGDEGREAAVPLLVEAGHQCAFNTFGGIMTSTEWEALILPQIKEKKDWVHGIVSVVNALGWGRWQVTDVSEEGAEFFLHNDYESVGHLAMYGKASSYVNFLAHGGVAGCFNLVYVSEIEKSPELSPAFYSQCFKGVKSYSAECLSSRAMGQSMTSFRVYKEK